MFWEEKIEILKKNFPASDFSIPFIDWSVILKKIESKFIARTNTDYHFSNWEYSLKKKIFIRDIERQQVWQEIQKLDAGKNYWVVIVRNDFPTSTHLIYDCKPNALGALLGLTNSSFYIIDKKYSWLVFFKIEKEAGKVMMIKGSAEPTPFDA